MKMPQCNPFGYANDLSISNVSLRQQLTNFINSRDLLTFSEMISCTFFYYAPIQLLFFIFIRFNFLNLTIISLIFNLVSKIFAACDFFHVRRIHTVRAT